MIDARGAPRNPAARLLANTPTGRFLLRLHSRMPTWLFDVARELHGFPLDAPPNPWLFEAILQHYGFPTFALDVTHSPLVALYFSMYSFRRGRLGALEPILTDDSGVVYVLLIPKDTPYRRGIVEWPRLSGLYDLSLDNFSRPRRQFAALLPEAGYLELTESAPADQADLFLKRSAVVPQASVYGSYIHHVIRFSPRFRESPGARRIVAANLGAWLFPPEEIDLLYRRLRSASRRWFPVYNFRYAAEIPRREDQFEFTRARRIVLVGSDSGTVRRTLGPIWQCQMGWIEELPVEEVLRLASTCGEPERLDIVFACERDLRKASELQELIHTTGFRNGRLFGTMATGGEAQPNDGFEDHLQNMLFEGQLELSRARYDRWMKPEPDRWETFLDRVEEGRVP